MTIFFVSTVHSIFFSMVIFAMSISEHKFLPWQFRKIAMWALSEMLLEYFCHAFFLEIKIL